MPVCEYKKDEDLFEEDIKICWHCKNKIIGMLLQCVHLWCKCKGAKKNAKHTVRFTKISEDYEKQININ